MDKRTKCTSVVTGILLSHSWFESHFIAETSETQYDCEKLKLTHLHCLLIPVLHLPELLRCLDLLLYVERT